MDDLMGTPAQGDLFAAKAARDEALDRVGANSGAWMTRAIAVVELLIPRGWTGMGEDVRHIVAFEVGEPHVRNAWGAMIRTAISRGLLIPTGQYQHPKDTASHASKKQVLRRT
jgi:hypothetical protein